MGFGERGRGVFSASPSRLIEISWILHSAFLPHSHVSVDNLEGPDV